jgi:ATP adenylyltransferase
MDRLWAPWRQEYLDSESEECIFCKLPSLKDDATNLILLRKKYTFLIMNKYPYNSGHLMIAPYRHITSLDSMQRREFIEMMELVNLSCNALKIEYGAQGFNIGMNIGRAAGAGYEHLHIHVVPRWNGDTNYMPVISDTKVIPEHLNKTYARLASALDKIMKKG